MKTLFICRGSAEHGIGHVIRSRAVYSAMNKIAESSMVIIGDEYIENLLAGREINYSLVKSESEVMQIFSEVHPEIVVFDLTLLDAEIVRFIGEKCLTVSLSPVFNHLSEVDLVFHRSVVRGEQWATGHGKPIIKAGLEYAVISKHCTKIPEDVFWANLKHERMSIAISMGGTDAANKALRTLQQIKKVAETELLIWVLLGEGYGHSYQALVDCMRNSRHEIILAKTNDSMWRILNTCSFVILAGGTTTFEAAFSALPSINTLEKEEQYFLVQELVEKNVCLCAGHSFEESMQNINALIARLSTNRGELFSMHLKCHNLIDGMGAERIVDETYRHYLKRKAFA